MKRNMKKIVGILLIAILAVTFVNVNAKSVTITERGYVYPDSENSNRREPKYIISNGYGYGYCITPERKGTAEGSSLQYVGDINDGGLLYLLENANNDSDYEYLATQIAIWRYTGKSLPDFYTKNNSLSVVRKSDEYARDAQFHRNNSSMQESSVELEYDGSAFEVKHPDMIADKQPLKSGIFTVHITNGQTTAIEFEGAPKGTKAYATDGTELNSIENGTEFYIVVPTASITEEYVDFTVRVSASGIVKTVERYSIGDDEYQDLITISSRKSSDSDELSFRVKGHVVKTDNKCEFVDGKYFDEEGNEIDQKTYLTTCEVHKCEKVGEYYFDEDGAITDEETYDKQCVKHTCEKVGNTYYDSLGVITSYDEYRTQCELVSCEIINGKYFGNEGNIVTPQEFRNQCEAQIVPVPDTATTGIISIIIGLLMLTIAGKCVINYRKNN